MEIISRSAWGAAPPRNAPTRVSWSNDTLWLHHTTDPTLAPTVSRQEEAAAMRRTQAFHQGPQRGWNDIGYAFICFPSGRLYEGRGRGVLAAHCPGHNGEPSVSLAGNYVSAAPSIAQFNAVHRLRQDLGLTRIRGHREAFPTACPGDAAVRFFQQSNFEPLGETTLEHGNTLRLTISVAGGQRQRFAGWEECTTPLRKIAQDGVPTGSTAVIAWRHHRWDAPADVVNVAKSLVRRFL